MWLYRFPWGFALWRIIDAHFQWVLEENQLTGERRARSTAEWSGHREQVPEDWLSEAPTRIIGH